MRFYLVVHQPAAIWSGRVTSTPTGTCMSVPFYNGTSGTAIPGETVFFGTTPSGSERGMCRLRSIPSGTTGYLGIGENYDVGPMLVAGDYITIKEEFRLWPINPRITSPTTFFEDYDIPYTDENQNWRPIAVAGPPAVGFYESGYATCSFVGNSSYTLAPGATIASQLWTAHGSVEGTSAVLGTPGAPVVFTWNTPGQYLVSLKVTDSLGNSHTAYTHAFIFNGQNPPSWVFVDFDDASESGAWDQGGWQADYTVRTLIGENAFPPSALVIHATYSDLVTPTATWPFREEVLFVGRILEGSVWTDPISSAVSFRAATIDENMRNTYPYPGRMEDSSSPTKWVEGYMITVDRLLSHLAVRRSTLASVASLMPSLVTDRIYGQDFDTVSLYDQISSQILESIWGKLCSTSQGVLYCQRDAQVMLSGTERGALTVRKALDNTTWLNRLQIGTAEPEAYKTGHVESSGAMYGGVAPGIPMFAEAPGPTPRFRGGSEQADYKVVTSQAELNQRTGHLLAQKNNPYPKVSTQFINDGSFDIVPQEYFPITLQPWDNARGVSWQAKKCIPRNIKRSYNHQQGSILLDVDFEPETYGNAGMTVVQPVLTGTVQPPAQTCESGFHWDTTLSGCVPDALPHGTGKNVIMGAAVCGIARIVRCADINAVPPVWTAIDGGGLASNDWITGGIKLDPWNDRKTLYAATAHKLYKITDYTAVSPTLVEVADVTTIIGGSGHDCHIMGFSLSIEENGLIVIIAQKTVDGITIPVYLLHSHDGGANWYSEYWVNGGALPDWTYVRGMCLDFRPDSGKSKPHVYVTMENRQWYATYQFTHNVDHTWTEDTHDHITAGGLFTEPYEPFVPYTPAGVGDFYWVVAKTNSQAPGGVPHVLKMPGSTDIGPTAPVGLNTAKYFDVATWDRERMIFIVDGKVYTSVNRGVLWTAKTDPTSEIGIRAAATFAYNTSLVYGVAKQKQGNAPGVLVMYSPDFATTWLDKTGNIATLLGFGNVNEYFFGRAIVATWTGD